MFEIVGVEDSVDSGIKTAILLHSFQIIVIPVLIFGVPAVFQERSGLVGLFFALWGWGVTRLVYMIPAAWRAWRHGHTETAKGIMIVAGAGFLLNALCVAVLRV